MCKLCIEKPNGTCETLEFNDCFDLEDYVVDNYNNDYNYLVECRNGIWIDIRDMY